MVGRLLEGRQHEHRVLHLGDSETSDSENLSLGAVKGQHRLLGVQSTVTYLVAHDISQQHQMTRIDSETVRSHGVINLADDASASGLDTKNLLDLHDVVGRGLRADDTCARKRVSKDVGD